MFEQKVSLGSQRLKAIVIQKPQQPEEVEAIAQLDKILSLEPKGAKLAGSNGEEIFLPESVCDVLRHVVQMMASGQPIHLIPHNYELTAQEAADILNVSRPFLVKLLEQGEIPYTRVGSHRRIRLQDLMAYKEQRDVKRDRALTKLIEMSQEAGFYE